MFDGGQKVDDQIRVVLAEHARLPLAATELADDADLYQAGLTSHASVNLMLALEDAFDVEFPDEMLRRSTFETIAAIRIALVDLGARVPVS
jgi:acyl carrier protein